MLANSGVAADTRKAISGHNSDAIHERYTRRAVESLRGPVDTIGNLIKQAGK